MISANELRIGNWVKAPEGSKYNGCNIQWGLNEFYWIGECVQDFDDFKPIPLTEDILLKCGFWYDRTNGEYRDDESNLYLAGPDAGEIGNWYDNNLGLDIKHLHQLQNLYFALTQTELIIEL